MGTVKIGNNEFAIMVAVFLIGTASMLVPVLGVSEQDMWIASFIGWITGIVYALFLGSCKEPQGRYPLIRIILSLYALLLAALVARNLGMLMNLTVMIKTPLVVFNASLVLLSAYAVKQGIEAISRLGVFFLIVYTMAEVILIFMSVLIMKPEHMQPVFDHSFGLIMRDAIPFSSFPFMEAVVFLPLLKMVEKPRKALIGGTLIGGGLLIIAFIGIILVLPPSRVQYIISPTFLAVNSLPGSNFAQAIVMAIWMQTGFMKLAVLHYVVSNQLGIALNINYRVTVLPISVLIVSLSILMFDNIIEMFNFSFKIYPYFAIPFQVGIPLCFVLLGWLRHKTSGPVP